MIENLWGSSFQIILSFLLVFCNIFPVLILARKISVNQRRTIYLYIWHTIMGGVYLYYINAFGGDALGYYKGAKAGAANFEFGTASIKFIMAPFVQGLNFSFMNMSLLFSMVGCFGLIFLQASLDSIGPRQKNRFDFVRHWLPYLPSLSFWSSAIGKDSISFCAVCISLYASLNIKHRKIFFLIGVLLMLIVRPHIAAAMILGLALSTAVDPRYSISTRFLLALVGIAGAVITVPLALRTSGLEKSASIGGYISSRQEYNQIGGGAVDISTMNLPTQMFTYVFRPLPYEAHSIFSLFASLDNILLSWLVYYAAKSYLHRRGVKLKAGVYYMLLYTAVVLPILASTTANLGIAMRQKWMFMPMLLWVCLYLLWRPVQQSARRIANPARVAPTP